MAICMFAVIFYHYCGQTMPVCGKAQSFVQCVTLSYFLDCSVSFSLQAICVTFFNCVTVNSTYYCLILQLSDADTLNDVYYTLQFRLCVKFASTFIVMRTHFVSHDMLTV